jgi:hypothetical protein
MDSSTTTSKKRRDGKIFKTPLADQLGVARRETGRKRHETPAMAEFMNEQLTKKKRGRKSSKTVSSHFESDLTATASATTTIRTEAELAEMAAALSHVPRDQWPDDVLTYQREQQRLKKRKDREMQIEDDRLRREVEQQRRQESSSPKSLPNEPEEQRRDPRLRAATKAASYKRQRQSEVDAANAVPADLMTDDEIEAARTAPLSAPNEELKQHIVNRTRAALSDANQGQRVCAVCDECVFKNESRLGPFGQSVERSLQQRCSAARQQLPLDVTLISHVPAKKLVRKFGARHATLVVDENMMSQVSFRFCLSKTRILS